MNDNAFSWKPCLIHAIAAKVVIRFRILPGQDGHADCCRNVVNDFLEVLPVFSGSILRLASRRHMKRQLLSG